jgi:glycosyltransferase involved in cell wall biosynthesis
MKVCFLGMENLPVLAPEYRQNRVGGEAVQQTLLARALARRGYEVTMVVGDYGQAEGAQWDTIRTFKAYRPDAGLPILRFIHPRWTGVWSALARADADVYYTSCAGMQVGLLALFCRRFRKRFVFRAASDTDCDRSRVRLRYARDRWLYAYGLRHADAILVQSAAQAANLERSYGLASRVAWMLVEKPRTSGPRDIDLLWVANIQRLKRPDRIIELAALMPGVTIHMAGGAMPGTEALYDEVRRAAAAHANIRFHGRLPYWDASELYGRARIFVNTSDIEGFPNSYLQSWIRGVPVITLIDPDGVIEREGLGIAARAPAQIADAVRSLLHDTAAWRAASERCRAYMDREYAEDKLLEPYVDTFERIVQGPAAGRPLVMTRSSQA